MKISETKQVYNAILVNFETIDTPDISELQALVNDLGINIVDTLFFKPHNKKFLGKGQMEQIQVLIESLSTKVDYVVFNGFLSGLKIKLMEKYIKTTILSRVDIIIQVFEHRAHTQEGMLQVKLAKLLYHKSKLVRYWTHLERQRGGTKGIGGPGETQLELDKRIIDEKISHIKKQLTKITQDRQVQSINRQDPIISLVGYSNAGKTTLFNLLTNSTANVSSKPFETLDPFIRPAWLSNSQKVLISDTVGFVTNLPPFLIKAFRATLEQITRASIIVCVHDCTNSNNIDEILKWFEILKVTDKPILYVLNKSDLEGHQYIANAIKISCKTGDGIPTLQQAMIDTLNNTTEISLHVPYNHPELLAWLMKHGSNIKTNYLEESIALKCILTNVDHKRLKKLFNILQ